MYPLSDMLKLGVAPEITIMPSTLKTTGRGMPTNGGFDGIQDVAFFSSPLIARIRTAATWGTDTHVHTNAESKNAAFGLLCFSSCGTHIRKWCVGGRNTTVVHMLFLFYHFRNHRSICHTKHMSQHFLFVQSSCKDHLSPCALTMWVLHHGRIACFSMWLWL